MRNKKKEPSRVECAHDAMVDTATLVPNPRNPKSIKGIYGDVECGDGEDFTGKTAELIKE